MNETEPSVTRRVVARLATQDVAEIRDLRGWLVVVVRRLALDRIGSAHGRLSAPHDPTAPGLDVAADLPDPADRVTLDDEIRRALALDGGDLGNLGNLGNLGDTGDVSGSTMAVVATRDGELVAVIRLLVVDGLIAAIHTVLLPAALMR